MIIKKTKKQLRDEAIAVLVEFGICRYMKDVNLYHGRTGNGTLFSIKNLNNAGNNTGNMNVSAIPGLYTAQKDIATEFAIERKKERGGQAEVHKIVGINENDVIIDINFDISSIRDEDKPRVTAAFRVLADFPVTDLLPINFEYKEIYKRVILPVLQDLNAPLISESMLTTVLQQAKKRLESLKLHAKNNGHYDKLNKLNIDDKTFESLVKDYISARNTKNLLRKVPTNVLYQIRKTALFSYDGQLYPISRPYIYAWIKNNNIAGFKSLVSSATLEKKIIAYQLVNIPQIMTESDFGRYYQALMKLEEIATQRFSNSMSTELKDYIDSACGAELVELASQNLQCAKLYDKNPGLWEGWTVGQHTASVIDFFDTYYSDSLPDNMQPIMKLILLAHDIGKGDAYEKGVPQKQTNQKDVDVLLDSLNIKDGLRQIVHFVMGVGQDYTTRILIKEKDEHIQRQLIKELNQKCKEVLTTVFGKRIKGDEVSMLRNLCLILQFCDSGAYTYYAKIKEEETYVTGGNAGFTKSFEQTNKNTPILKKAQNLGLVLPTTLLGNWYPPFYSEASPLLVL